MFVKQRLRQILPNGEINTEFRDHSQLAVEENYTGVPRTAEAVSLGLSCNSDFPHFPNKSLALR
jgi:hypothetical protein